MYPVALMSERLNTRVFTQGEFDRSGRLERLYIHMLDPQFHLNDTEERLLSDLKRVFELISDKVSRADGIQAIMGDFGCTRAHAANLFAEASDLFGRMLQVNKKYDRAVIREKLAKLSEKAEMNEEYGEARKCLEAIVKLDNLFDQEEAPVQERQEPAQVFFTNDPKVLEIGEG